MDPELHFTPDMTCTLSKKVFMPITNKKPWLMYMLSYNHSAKCCDILYTTLLHLQNKMIFWWEITQSFYYSFVPNLILTPIEYTFTLSQSQVLKVLDVIGIDYKSSKHSAKESGRITKLNLVSSSSNKHQSFHRKGRVRRKCRIQQKSPHCFLWQTVQWLMGHTSSAALPSESVLRQRVIMHLASHLW